MVFCITAEEMAMHCKTAASKSHVPVDDNGISLQGKYFSTTTIFMMKCIWYILSQSISPTELHLHLEKMQSF